MSVFLFFAVLALLCGGAAGFRSFMGCIGAALGLLFLLVCFALFGWWVVAVLATVLGLGVTLSFMQKKERERAVQANALRLERARAERVGRELTERAERARELAAMGKHGRTAFGGDIR